MSRRWIFLVLVLCSCASVAPTSAPVSTATPEAVVDTSTATAAPVEPTIAAESTAAPVEPTAAPADDAVLPKPLYVLSSLNESGIAGQIWRIETDGTTITQVTNEPNDVMMFAVSPVDGSLAYVTDNDLVIFNPQTNERRLVLDGPVLDPNSIESSQNRSISSPRWSPDGNTLAVSYGGVALIPAAGGEPTIIIPNEPQLDPNMAAMFPMKTLYLPEAWSPDGQRLLVTVGYVPEGGGLLVTDLQGQEKVTISNPDGMACCEPTWSPDGSTIVFASAAAAIVPAGLWRADTTTGATERLVPSGTGEAPGILVRMPIALFDGTVRSFMVNAQSFDIFAQPLALTIHDVKLDGTIIQLQEQPNVFGTGLWFPDGSAAVVIPPPNQALTMQIVYADGRPAVELPLEGLKPAWGP